MMMIRTLLKATALIATVMSLSACAATHPPLGSAINHNTNAQAIAPTSEQKQNTYIPADAARQRLARDKYRKNEVEELRLLKTQSD